MRLSKIYTKVGDDGSTLLATGERVPKDDLRIEAYGNVDELNAVVGLFKDSLSGEANRHLFEDLIHALKRIQNELFDIGGELSFPGWGEKKINLQTVGQDQVDGLEKEIDQYNTMLKPLENFVLPGGHISNSISHLCRTVCRRTERRIISLGKVTDLRPELVKYVNRLSDWFFVSGRVVSARLNIEEPIWQQRKTPG